MTIYLLSFALAVIGPYAATAWYINRAKIVFQGSVPVSTFAFMASQSRPNSIKSKSELLPVRMPDGATLWVEVSRNRFKVLPENIKQVAITVKKPLIGQRYVESMKFPGEEVELPGDKDRRGLCLSVFYYGIAFSFLYWLMAPAHALMLGYAGIFCPMALAFLAGWLAAQANVPSEYTAGKSYGRLVSDRAQRLSFWILTLPTALMSALTIATWNGCGSGQLMIAFVGLNTSLALGMLLGFLFKPAVQHYSPAEIIR